MLIIRKASLPTVSLDSQTMGHIFDGATHAATVSAFVVDLPPEAGPPRHQHPYEEIFVIVDGKVRVEADGESFDATHDEICVVPAGVTHTFTNLGPGRARMVNIHAHAEVITRFVGDTFEHRGYRQN